MSSNLITISLAEYLQLRWSYKFEHGATKDFAVIDRKLGIAIQSLDTHESLCHVEFPDNPEQANIAIVWGIKEWRASEERRVMVKAQSAWEREFSFACKDLAKTLADKLNTVTMGILTAEQLLIKSRQFIDAGQFDLIETQFGVSCSELKTVLERKPK